MMILPERLHKGDKVGVIAPASPPNLSNLKKAIPFFENLGLEVEVAPHVEKVHGYLAGTDEQRLEDLHSMFINPEINAIVCAGGGFGTSRIADNIDFQLIKENPKIFWGYSDITYLHTAIRQETGLVTFHGPMLASDIGKEDFHPLSKKSFDQLFKPSEMIYDESISRLEAISEGEASGQIVGGNLSLLVNSLGGPYEIETEDRLLFIEDIGEEPYRVDSFLSQLKLAGKLDEAAGVIIGDFNDAEPKKEGPSFTLNEVLEDYFAEMCKPVIKGFQIGHCQPHFAIPFGTKAVISSAHKTLTIQPGVQ
ncbi:LD-carboxypeptidase [Halalkalibacillus sediminis]|uniref:LD-carboxypeptidase n=1 Tax=Halalkalibacillus sediminis TaxID=2018042 RepID=A0A2I0QTB1_9BACI|nr:LD-carboxypeptidase [Halalkalibacillus sediminis]PKR77549.1 LD-carboxypeptidase [Halalkalibacillus sediminis]